MPNNPRTPKRSWRGERAASARPSAGRPAWKAERPGAPGPRVSRGAKILVAAALFLLVAAGVVIVYLWLRPIDPFRLVLVGAGYEQDLAAQPNVLGRHGLDGLEKWAKDYNDKPLGRDKGKNVDVHPQTIGETNDPVGDALANTNAPKVVVFLSADGGGDDQGAYVLPDGASPQNLDAVYRIDKVLDALKKLDAKTPKLLLLDASHNGPNWSMRELHNDFARSVRKMEPKIKEIGNLVVLCACDEGQQSWASEEFGQTVFAHYVIEGLRGAADRKGDPDDPDHFAGGDGSGSVSALELAHYVQFQVERWVRRNRAADQKPFLLGDEAAAEHMDLVVADGDYKEPDPSAVPSWSPPEDLGKAWQEHEDLAKTSPPPAAYTPQQWREYEAALLRYEQLLRADDGAAAGAMRQRVNTLHGKIVHEQQLDLASTALSLAEPAAFGWPTAADPADPLTDAFNGLWDGKAKPDQYTSLLADAANRTADRLKRLRLIGLLLQKAPRSHDDYLRVCAILPKLAAPPAPAPAEANFAVMAQDMEARLPTKAVASWDRLKQALTIRPLAERAALGLSDKPDDLPAYSEQTAAWIQAAVDDADKDRRVGEDLVFARQAEDGKAAAALAGAEAAYRTVGERALAVRQAIHARDRALAELPWYTQWLGRLPKLPKADEDQLAALWAGVHELCDRLDKPDYAKAASLAAATDPVNTGLDRLKGQFDQACKEMQSAKALQDNLNSIEDLLSVPLIEPDLRMDLLKDARRISLALNVGTAKAAAAEPSQDAAARAKELAFRQGRLAVAVLGRDTQDGKDVANLLPPIDKPQWQNDLDTAGDRAGRAFQGLAKKAEETAEQSRKAPLADAAAPLRLAALQTRFLDAGEADAWLASVDPAAENRRAQLHDLLVWQAERTRLDYWASPDPANPYYRAAGLVYAGDARDFAAGEADLRDEEKEARLAAVKRVESLLRAPDAVAFRWLDGGDWKADAEKLHLTDEKTIELRYALVGPKDAPAGRPVVWARPGPKLIPPPDAGSPQPLGRLSDKPEEAAVPYVVTPNHPTDPEPPPGPGAAPRIPPPPAEDTDFGVTGLFRGRERTLDTPIRLHNRPDLVSYQPKEEPKAHIAVQATRDDFNRFAAQNSELVVVLDYSGSMKTPQGDGSRRLDKALDALKACLRKLPTGVNLTVLTFSADSNADIAVQRKLGPWNPVEASGLMDRLGRLGPQGYTPLVRATAEAAKYFTPGFKGAKTVVVLTDGGDNEFHSNSPEGQAMRAEAPTMAKFLHKRLDDTGILVDVVGFQLGQLTDDDEKKGYKEFKPAIEDIGGTFTTVDKAEELAAELERYFLQIRFLVENEHGEPVQGTIKEGLHISLDTEDQRPTVDVPAPGSYFVLIQARRNQDHAQSKLPDQHVRVQPGEVLVLDLKDAGGGFELRRDVYARSNALLNNSRPVADPVLAGKAWLLTFLSNRRVQNAETRDAREITVAAENTHDDPDPDGTLRQLRPALMWFGVTREGDKQPASGLRFFPVPNYPAPVWRLSLADWKPGAAPVVDAWWYEDALPDNVSAVLRQGRDYTHTSELKARSVEVRPTEDDALTHVVVEGVSWERRTVELSPGQWKRDVDCLVVRLRYPEGRPYFVQLPEDVRPAGYEHRFYWDANRYTGVFFGLEPKLIENLAWLKLVSVEGAHRHAVRVDAAPIRRDGDPPLPIEN